MEIPGYSIKRMLGKGGMASVYLANQDKFDRDVALKVMAPALSSDPSFRDRFLREAKIVAKISHPNIVAVYDVNEVNDIYYIAMEYHPGGDLKGKIRAGLTTAEAISIIRDIAKALDYAHSKGYLHRDIKPDNILFRADGSAVLTDFGIAKATEGDANLTQMGLVAGTPKYMSPEQARGLPLEADSDLYSLGVVFFEALTGNLPFQATDPIALGIMHLNSPIPKLEGRLSHFQPLLDRLMAKNAAERPHRGSEVVRELEALAATFDFGQGDDAGSSENEATAFRPTFQPGGLTRPPVTPVGRVVSSTSNVPVKARKSPLPLLLVGIAVIGIAGTGGYMMMHGSDTPPPVVATPNPALSVQDMLDRAAVAFERGDLVLPAGKSAADIYHMVLAKDPNNGAAQTGLQQIATALQQQALAALGTNDIAQAELHMEQLRALSPNDPALAMLEKSIDAAKAGSAAPRVARQATAAPAPVVQAPAAPVAAPAPVVKAAPPVVIAPPPSAPPVAEDDQDDQEASKIEQENALKRLQVHALLGAAQQALTEGDNATAVTRFQQVLHVEPGNVEARDGLDKAKAALAATP